MDHCIVIATGETKTSVYECQYALLSYLSIYNLNPPASIRLLVYTNQPAAFEAYTTLLPTLEMKEYVYQSKLDMIQEAMDMYDGNIIYCDSDTYPYLPLEPLLKHISDQKLITLLNDAGVHETPVHSIEAIKNHLGPVEGNTSLLPAALNKNVAVIGISSSELHFIQKCQTIANSLQGQLPRNLSINLAIQKTATIHSRESHWEYFKHYHQSIASKELISYFFQHNEEESIPNLVKLIHLFDLDQVEQEYISYSKQPFYKRWLANVLGIGWSLDKYKKKL